MQSGLACPVCGGPSSGGYSTGDSTVFICPRCGGFRLSGIAVTLFGKGVLRKPDPGQFRDLVKQKRGTMLDYPVITLRDLGQ